MNSYMLIIREHDRASLLNMRRGVYREWGITHHRAWLIAQTLFNLGYEFINLPGNIGWRCDNSENEYGNMLPYL